LKSDLVIKLVLHWIARWKLDFTDLHIPPSEPQVRPIQLFLLRGFAVKPGSLQYYAAGIVINVLQVSHAVFCYPSLCCRGD